MAYRICVDISSSAIKALIGQHRGNRFIVEDFYIQPYDSRFNSDRHLSVALKELLWEMDLRGGYLHVAISSAYAIFRYAMFPDVEVRDLETVLACEGKKYLPDKKSDVILQGMPFQAKGKLKEPILLVGVDKDYLEKVDHIIREVGFRTRFVSVDSLILANLISYMNPFFSSPVCVVDIGYRLTKIMILKEDKIVFIRSAKVGSFDIDLLIHERLDVALEAAEAIKKGENAIADVISLSNRILNYLCDEIYISIDFYESQFGEVPERMFITGGGAKLKGLVEVLSEKLGLEVFLFHLPESKILCYSSNKDFWKYQQELMVAVGLLLV